MKIRMRRHCYLAVEAYYVAVRLQRKELGLGAPDSPLSGEDWIVSCLIVWKIVR
jgi:hypothetical protein